MAFPLGDTPSGIVLAIGNAPVKKACLNVPREPRSQWEIALGASKKALFVGDKALVRALTSARNVGDRRLVIVGNGRVPRQYRP